ncbi:MAG: glycogen/starch/alpha-glucan phosphorylase [Chromatiales bacterium]|nr:glycogen/starch/alpha-glucan phosphorylase [Chromatiales bacterium]
MSTAGKEASGTGNMKFSMNGALTIGTLDGANVEIREEVGAENFFLFGLTAEEVLELKARGLRPAELLRVQRGPPGGHRPDRLRASSPAATQASSSPWWTRLLDHDEYLLLADYQSYIDCQDRVSAAYRDQERWTRMSILNVARMGKFSSDRSIREYCEKIWKVQPVPIRMD